MNTSLKTIVIAILFIISQGSSRAQSCLNCTSSAPINNGLIFCATMTGNADDGTTAPVTPTITGTVALTTDRYNIANTAYDFTNSSSTRITYSASAKLNVPSTQSYTMSIWFYQRNLQTVSSYIASLSSSDVSNFAISIGGTANAAYAKRLTFQDYHSPSQTVRAEIISSDTVKLNSWNHVAITIDKSTGLHTLYLNGVSVGTTNSTNNSVITNPNVILGNNSLNAWGINGKVDDVRIYNRALSISEINSLYLSTIPAPTPVTNQSICKGDSIQLNPGTSIQGSYSWSPASSLNNFTLVKPIAKPKTTTKYYVTIQAGLCSVTDSLTVLVDSIQLSASDQNVCMGDTVMFNASGATTYQWSPSVGLSNPNIANPKLTVTQTAFYAVKGTNGACSAVDTVVVTACACNSATIYDTVTITIIDSVKINVYDSIKVTVFDTTRITLRDTTFITIRDTAHITIHDTITVTLTDTIYKTITDTMHIVIRDTIPIGVTDTLYINIVKTGLNLPNNILNTLKVYPNPASDEVVIDNGNYLQMPNYSVKIINVSGQTVFTSIVNRQSFRINTADIGGIGTYFIQVLDNNNNIVETKKLVFR